MKTCRQVIKIAVIEDNELYNHLLTNGLKSHIHSLPYSDFVKFEVRSYTDATVALKEIAWKPDIVFLDYFLNEKITGIDVLRSMKKINPNCKVIILSQVQNAQTSILPLVEGASNFILKDSYAITLSCFTAASMIQRKLN